jgi:aminoglycoside phosphotransferase (APT) family kinase protein
MTSTLPAPPAEGERLPWSQIPAPLRAEVERLLGGRVAEAVTQRGGFSPGVAARIRLDNGRRAFVKAVGDINPDSPGIHRAEARIAGALPASTPAPRLLGCIDADGWVILLLEDIEGSMPAQPWQPAELDRVLAAMADLAVALTPAPVEAQPVTRNFSDAGTYWQQLADSRSRGRDDLDPWAAAHLDELAALDARWPVASRGGTLAHADIRADNILLTGDRVVFVDWPWAALAPPWFDLVAMLPSVVMQGGPPAEQVLASHPVAAGADEEAITAVLATIAGFFLWDSTRPDPPGLPTLRAFQRAQGVAAVGWLQARLTG